MSCANHAKAHSVRLSDPSSSSAVGAPNVSACEEVRECIRSGTQTETSAEQSTHTHGTGRERKLDVKIRRSYHIINGAQCCVRSSSLASGSSEDGEKRHPAAPHTPHPNSSVSSLTICKSTVLRIVSIYSTGVTGTMKLKNTLHGVHARVCRYQITSWVCKSTSLEARSMVIVCTSLS